MRWDNAMDAVLARLRGDSALLDALGGDRITRADASAAPQVPGVTWEVTGTRRRETEEVVFTRWEVRAPTLAGEVAVEERLWANLDRTTVETVGGISMTLELLDSRDVPDAGAGVVQRTLEFRFAVPRG